MVEADFWPNQIKHSSISVQVATILPETHLNDIRNWRTGRLFWETAPTISRDVGYRESPFHGKKVSLNGPKPGEEHSKKQDTDRKNLLRILTLYMYPPTLDPNGIQKNRCRPFWYVSGHGPSQKYQTIKHMPRNFAENGFVCMIIENHSKRRSKKATFKVQESNDGSIGTSRGYNPAGGSMERASGFRSMVRNCQKVDQNLIWA